MSIESKRLRDYTLGEIRQLCNARYGNEELSAPCIGCQFYDICQVNAQGWDLTFRYYTDSEVRYAKDMSELMPDMKSIERMEDGSLYAISGYDRVVLKQDTFPSVQPGQHVSIETIAHDGDDVW